MFEGVNGGGRLLYCWPGGGPDWCGCGGRESGRVDGDGDASVTEGDGDGEDAV